MEHDDHISPLYNIQVTFLNLESCIYLIFGNNITTIGVMC